jgi:tRNA nucleotidyltransferase (CCA-adding enzyme)
MELFHRLSGQRLLDELRLLFSERTPRQAVRRLADLNLLRFIHPKLTWTSRLDRRLIEVEAALDWYKLSCFDQKISGWLVYAMALVEEMPDQAVRDLLERFPFTVGERTAITASRFLTQQVFRTVSRRAPLRPSETVRLLTGLSDETLVFLLAKNKSESAKRRVSQYLTAYREVKPALTGKNLQSLGLKPGPLYSAILARLTEARLDGEVKSEAEELVLVNELARRDRKGVNN